MQLHLVDGIVVAVEDDHLAAAHLIHHQRTHIGVVHHKGGGVGKHDLLIDHPVLRHFGIEIADQLHAVKLHAHALGVMLFSEGLQSLVIQRVLIFNDLDINIGGGEGGGVIFLLALLADQQQGLFPCVEPVILQGALHKAGLAAVQEAGEYIYGNCHIRACLSQPWNSSAMAASLILEPMTQSLPMMPALPVRMSGSPGT